MSKHTPPPWTVGVSVVEGWPVFRLSEMRDPDPDGEEVQAVRDLIARAPDMEIRFRRIAEIIEGVDNRCMAIDGPISKTLEEMTEQEMVELYLLAKGDPASIESSKP